MRKRRLGVRRDPVLAFFWYCSKCEYQWSGSSATPKCPRCGAKLPN